METSLDHVRLEVVRHFSAQPNPSVLPAAAVVEGPAAESFDSALRRTFGDPGNRSSFNLVCPQSTGTAILLGWITPHVTLADASQVADGQPLHVDTLGRGGGVLPLMLEIVEAGLTVAGVVQSATWARSRMRATRMKTQRRLAREWLDAGLASEPPMALRQYVLARNTWVRSEFDDVFALDRASGAALLRILGFTKVSTSPERWAEAATS